MRGRRGWLVLLSLGCWAALAPVAWAADTRTPSKPEPGWLTAGLKAKVHAAGASGVQVPADQLNTACPGLHSPPGVSANGCIVSPHGCTANFVWTDSPGTQAWRTQPYIGTASHCSDAVGDRVIMQVDSATLAEVGTVVTKTARQVPGDDFALIRVDPDVALRWGVNPAIPTGGPQGIYTGCGPQLVKNYGHGYGVYMGQGKPELGVAPDWYNDGYGWFGVGAPGDSGSGITIQDDRSAGDFTHIIVYDPTFNFAPGELVGTRTTAILQFLGPGWAQVNADGTTATAGPALCGLSVAGPAPAGGTGNPDGTGAEGDN
jgi:hypothetical protein